MNYLKIQFPEDFDARYNAYKAKLLGSVNMPKIKPPESKKSSGTTKKFPHKLPSGTKWENFIINFLTNDKVMVKVSAYTEELDFRDMGFEDKRNERPNEQWELLRLLAKYSGEISWTDPAANVKLEKRKERLTNQLESYFSIDYDPFFPYKENNSYKIKITLLVSQADVEKHEVTRKTGTELLVTKQEKSSGEKMDNEIQEYYKSLTGDNT